MASQISVLDDHWKRLDQTRRTFVSTLWIDFVQIYCQFRESYHSNEDRIVEILRKIYDFVDRCLWEKSTADGGHRTWVHSFAFSKKNRKKINERTLLLETIESSWESASRNFVEEISKILSHDLTRQDIAFRSLQWWVPILFQHLNTFYQSWRIILPDRNFTILFENGA